MGSEITEWRVMISSAEFWRQVYEDVWYQFYLPSTSWLLLFWPYDRSMGIVGKVNLVQWLDVCSTPLLWFVLRHQQVHHRDPRDWWWSDLNLKLSKQLLKLNDWTTNIRFKHHTLIRDIHHEVITRYGDRNIQQSGHFECLKWQYNDHVRRNNHRGWEKLLQTLMQKGYGEGRISRCLFSRAWMGKKARKEYERELRLMDVGRGIETDTRAR